MDRKLWVLMWSAMLALKGAKRAATRSVEVVSMKNFLLLG